MTPTHRRVSLSLAVAIAACMAAPMAMAQSTDTASDPATAAAQETSADAAGATSWNDLDTDMDGRISKAEAAAMPALNDVFDQADTDADGALTSEEYQNYVANPAGAAGAPPEG